jgi:uncharacterized membrane-anchored protein YjiN (DUF445 family)
MNYKRKATITLILVASGFIVSSIFKYFYRDVIGIRLIFIVFEAALIGGMADWFAVTAIFRKPLGFSYHTAIIPKNRRAIVDSVVKIVEKEFLSQEILAERLNKINITSKAVEWLGSISGKKYLKDIILKLLKENINIDNARKISSTINSLIKKSIENIDLNKPLNELFLLLIKNGEYKRILEFVIDDIIKVVEGSEVRDKIYKLLDDIKTEKTQGFLGGLFNTALQGSNVLNIDELASSVHMHLIETLYNLKNEENPKAINIFEIIEDHLILNAENPFDNNGFEEIKGYILNNLIDEKAIINILLDFENLLKEYISSDEMSLIEKNKSSDFIILLFNEISVILHNMKNNEELRGNLEKFIKKSISIIIEKEHSVIGKIVRDTLDSFSDDNLNKFIEDRAGNDLQWIRINGSIVGGLVGLILFLFLNYFYDPLVVPMIRNLFI